MKPNCRSCGSLLSTDSRAHSGVRPTNECRGCRAFRFRRRRAELSAHLQGLRDPGHIYVLADSRLPGYLKLGVTQQPKRRLGQYATCAPTDCFSFLWVSPLIEDVGRVEASMLRSLDKCSQVTRERGEWFSCEHVGPVLRRIQRLFSKESSDGNPQGPRH